ncbi:hypothetical protein OQA88_13264 [Cercophora sp. LCS_1]
MSWHWHTEDNWAFQPPLCSLEQCPHKSYPVVFVTSVDSSSSTSNEDNLVTWDGPSDPTNPKNWSRSRKWMASIIVSTFAFLSPMSTSMIAPALSSIGEEFSIPDGVQLQLVLSISTLAYTIGPFIMSPCSEIWGRATIIRYSNLLFVIFTAACGFSRSQSQITAFRFLGGLGGCASASIGTGMLTDCWGPEERARPIGVHQLAQVLGPAIGPIGASNLPSSLLSLSNAGTTPFTETGPAAGYISANTTWRWCFFSIVIFNGAVQILAIFFLRETYAPRILQAKAKSFRASTSNPNWHTSFDNTDKSLTSILITAFSRPCLITSLYQAFNFGTFFLFIASFPAVWEEWYGQPAGPASLNYLSLTIGVAMFAASQVITFQCVSAYISDVYELHSASATAACSALRSLGGFAFPLFVPALFGGLGYGMGGHVLGIVAVAVGVPAPWIVWVFGRDLKGGGAQKEAKEEIV